MSEHVGRIAESWADEARSAALDARKRAHPDWSWGPTQAERKLGIVHVSNSRFGEGPHVADFQSFTPDGRYANVHLHLPDSHPAVQDAKGDFPDLPTDSMEWLDTVPVRHVESYGKNVPALGIQHASEHDRPRSGGAARAGRPGQPGATREPSGHPGGPSCRGGRDGAS